MTYAFQDLNESELAWLQDQLAQAAQFAGNGLATGLPSLAQLDEAFTRFVESDPEANERANSVILLLGAALGAHLTKTHGFSWVIATDDYGTDLAVVARRGCGDITFFPSDFIAKRWDRRETGFLADVPPWLSEMVAKSEQDWSNDA